MFVRKIKNLWRWIAGKGSYQKSQKSVSGEISFASRLVAHKLPRDGTEAVRIVNGARQTEADLNEDESIDYTIQAESRQGETGVLDICRTLIERLNRNGAHWGQPIKPIDEEGVDCEAYNDTRTLRIQVTRAERKQSIWSELSRSGQAKDQLTVDKALDALQKAIKAKEKRTPRPQRTKITLALDATDTPGHAFKHVIERFKRRYGLWARQLDFKKIWVVGPTVELTARIDVISSDCHLAGN